MACLRYITSPVVIALVAGMLLTPGASPVQANSAKTSIEPLRIFGVGSVIPGTGSILVRTKEGVSATLHAFGLMPGHVHTAWWAVFNNPKKCATSPCTFADFANPETRGSGIWGSGQIAGEDGTVDFVIFLAVGDTTGVLAGVGTAEGLLNTKKAEIHLVVRSHGPASADPAVLQEQLTMFNGGCPPNMCANVQAAPHQP